jgi:hypothetical protein
LRGLPTGTLGLNRAPLDRVNSRFSFARSAMENY